MDPEQLKILNEIAGLGSGAGMDTLDAQIAAARKLANTPSGSNLIQAGRRVVPDYGGALASMLSRSRASSDLSQLENAKLEMQRQQVGQARAGVNSGIAALTPASGGEQTGLQIDNVEGKGGTPVTSSPDIGIQDSRYLHGMLDNMDPLEAQKQVGELLKPRNIPYGAEMVNGMGKPIASNARNVAGTGGGQTTILQIAGALKAANPGMDDNTAIQQATVIARERYSNAEVAGVQGSRSGLTGTFTPNTDIGQVAGNEGAVKEAGATGAGLGTATAAAIVDKPLLEAQLKTALEGVDAFVTKAKKVRDNPALWRATGFLSYLPSLRGSAGANVEADIASLKAATGLEALTALKQKGQTLGQVTEAEHTLLQNQIASLSTISDDAHYRAQINIIIATAERMANAAKREMVAKTTLPRASMLPRSTGVAPAPASNDPLGIRR